MPLSGFPEESASKLNPLSRIVFSSTLEIAVDRGTLRINLSAPSVRITILN